MPGVLRVLVLDDQLVAGPASTLARVRLSVTLTVPPRAGSAVTRYAAFSMVFSARRPRHSPVHSLDGSAGSR